ncbi:hypothetical protein GCM10007880_63430 [Mesorhizobium amorphae]|nr:hypothetical protein GCM10007880_63430 [Mesorhizobium amorphae]
MPRSRDDLATGEDGDVFQHGLAAINEARSLDGGDLQAATQLVDDQRGQSLAFDVFRDEREIVLLLGNILNYNYPGMRRAD